MNVSYWLLPRAKDAEVLAAKINQLSTEYDAPVFAPHMTLYSGVGELLPAKTIVRDVGRAFGAPRLRVGPTGQTEERAKTLYLNIERSNAVAEMAEQIKDEAKGGDYIFKPHLSLIYHDLDTDTRMALAKSSRVPLQEITFDRIQAVNTTAGLSKEGVAQWEVISYALLTRIG